MKLVKLIYIKRMRRRQQVLKRKINKRCLILNELRIHTSMDLEMLALLKQIHFTTYWIRQNEPD